MTADSSGDPGNPAPEGADARHVDDETPEVATGGLRVNGTVVAADVGPETDGGGAAPAPAADLSPDEAVPDDEAGSDTVGPEDLTWTDSYDRESVERYLAAVEEEKARLRAEIQLAEERALAAEQRCLTDTTEQSAERDAQLGALMLAAREEMDRVEAEQRAIVDAIRAMAEDEAAEIRARAEADAGAVRAVASSFGPAVEGPEPMDGPLGTFAADLRPEGEGHGG